MAAVADMGAQLVMVADADSGMAASIRAGATGVGGALMILPADMPDLGAPEIAALYGVKLEQVIDFPHIDRTPSP